MTHAVGKSKAMEMCLSGEPITAEDALKWGLVSQVHPKDKLIEAAMVLAKKIASKSQIAAAYTKRSVKMSLDVGETAALNHERMLFTSLLGTKDKQEGVNAFLQKRKPNFTNQ